jgi:hypothetical protein
MELRMENLINKVRDMQKKHRKRIKKSRHWNKIGVSNLFDRTP